MCLLLFKVKQCAQWKHFHGKLGFNDYNVITGDMKEASVLDDVM